MTPYQKATFLTVVNTVCSILLNAFLILMLIADQMPTLFYWSLCANVCALYHFSKHAIQRDLHNAHVKNMTKLTRQVYSGVIGR